MNATEILRLNLKKVSDIVKFNGSEMTSDEIILAINEIQSLIDNKTPVYKRESKSGLRVTIYNSIGIQIGVDLPASDFKALYSVNTHRQFIFAGENERKIIESLKIRLCHIYKLPFFKNGNLYAKTKIKINQLLNS